jgi:hypothetical protein
VPQGARTQPLKPPLPHRMSCLPQTSAAGKTAGLPTAGEASDLDHDLALALGAAACVAAVIIGRWPARAGRASAHQPNGDP